MSGTAPPVADAPPTPTDPPPQPVEPRIRRLVAGLVLGLACVVGLAVIGLVAEYDGADRMPTGPALAPPSPTPVGLQFDQSTQRATYANIDVTLPGSPYLCSMKPEASPPFEQALTCHEVVHANYAKDHSWSADAAVALVPSSVAKPSPDDTAVAIFSWLRKTGYPADATVSKYELTSLGGHDDAYVLSARINVSVPKLPTTYDAAVVVVMTAKDNQQVVFYSLRPNDASAAGLKAVQASGRSITIS
jgi:hypothetical protein